MLGAEAFAMRYVQPKLSPGKGRFPKSPKKKAMRRYLLKAGGAYKKAIAQESGFHRSSGAHQNAARSTCRAKRARPSSRSSIRDRAASRWA
jgi:hypothetical protein